MGNNGNMFLRNLFSTDMISREYEYGVKYITQHSKSYHNTTHTTQHITKDTYIKLKNENTI